MDSGGGLRSSALEGEGDLVGGDGAFAEDHPGVAAAGEVDDGGGDGTCGGAAVYDERDLVGELGADEVATKRRRDQEARERPELMLLPSMAIVWGALW